MLNSLILLLEEYSTNDNSCYLKLFSDSSGRINIENQIEPLFQFDNIIMLENWIKQRMEKLYNETRE